MRVGGHGLRGVVCGVLLCLGLAGQGATTNVWFETGFEAEEGYDGRYTIVGQNGWIGEGTGGNGLVTNFFTGMRQQAFIGYFPPLDEDTSLSVWQPLNYTNTPGAGATIRFSVTMSIIDSSNGNYDEFRWSAYNTGEADAHRFFSLNFDNATYKISYSLDDTRGFIDTGHFFTNTALYGLVIHMNFASNLWSAFLDDVVIVRDQPITTVGAALHLGDIDAVWVYADPKKPGNNYLLFDDYRVIIVSPAPPEPDLELAYMGRLPGGQILVRVSGPPGKACALDFTRDFQGWQPLYTNTIGSTGWLDFLDLGAASDIQRFYRARRTGP
jgi:hypothetical protein